MNFRQRMAWLCLAFYLATSFAVVYYFLDIADQYALFSLEHSKLHKSGDSDIPLWKFWHHIGDIPFPVLMILLAVPYFQVFAALFYCTLPTANKNVNKCLVPVIGWIYMFQKLLTVFKDHNAKNCDTMHENLHVVSMSWINTFSGKVFGIGMRCYWYTYVTNFLLNGEFWMHWVSKGSY